jgi:hypothetical protein
VSKQVGGSHSARCTTQSACKSRGHQPQSGTARTARVGGDRELESAVLVVVQAYAGEDLAGCLALPADTPRRCWCRAPWRARCAGGLGIGQVCSVVQHKPIQPWAVCHVRCGQHLRQSDGGGLGSAPIMRPVRTTPPPQHQLSECAQLGRTQATSCPHTTGRPVK